MSLGWRRFLPDTVVGRTLMVLLIGLILSQLAGLVLFSINRLELANRLGAAQAAERIAAIVQLVDQTPEVERGRVVHALERPGLRVGWGLAPLTGGDDKAPESVDLRRELLRRLPGRAFHAEFRPRAVPPAPGEGPEPGPGMSHGRPPATFVAVRLDDGTWLNIAVFWPHEGTLWRPRFVGPLGGGLLVVVALSVMAVRRAAKPLRRLAEAAERLGRDVAAPPLPVAGPYEVRQAALAFNRMQQRLRRFITDRTQMIAAISHDLRTPITRLKLRAEFIDDEEQRVKMLADLDEMETMIAATLAFARDDALREAHQPLDLAQLLRGLCADFGASYAGPANLMVTAGQTGLKRAFANLLDNARKYGGMARVELLCDDGQIAITIDDNGPGIPENELERVFAPFYRVESSRNRETGGTGLGLAVARSVMRAHGGDISLSNRPGGGLSALVTVPI